MRLALSLLVVASVTATACGSGEGARSAPGGLADKWLTRARQSYRAGDFDDAREAAGQALKAAPNDPDARTLAATVAMSQLDFEGALKLTEGIDSTEAHRLRGRAHWYAGHMEEAADELEALLRDPQVRDPWARSIEKLARQGAGRKPFTHEGASITAVEMPKAGPALVVPCELNGERILALVATATAEVAIDSSTRREPAWVNLRFGERFEVKDVPAVPQDLSSFTRQFGAPIKALLGANLLRHLHVTFDRRGDQFVVRRDDAAPPPDAGRLGAAYIRGGGLMVRASVTGGDDDRLPMLVDSAAIFPVALEEDAWRRGGVVPSQLREEAGAPGLKTAVLARFKLGSYDLPSVPFVAGLHIDDARKDMAVDVAGVVGSGLLSLFRVTFADEGRTLYLEPDPAFGAPPDGAAGPPPADDQPPARPATPGGGGAAPAGAAPPKAGAKPAGSKGADPKKGPGAKP